MTRAEKWGAVLWLAAIAIAIAVAVTIETRAQKPDPASKALTLREDWLMYEADNGSRWYFREKAIQAISELDPKDAALAERRTTVHLQGVKIFSSDSAYTFFNSLESTDTNLIKQGHNK